MILGAQKRKRQICHASNSYAIHVEMLSVEVLAMDVVWREHLSAQIPVNR